MMHRFLLCLSLISLVISSAFCAQPANPNAQPHLVRSDEMWSENPEESGGGSSYLGVDIADVSAERLGQLKLKEEHGAEITEVDQDAPAGKAQVQVHDVIVSLNGTAVESAAQLRRMIKETPAGRVVTLGISRDGQPMTIKVQLADRHKSMAWEPEMPKIPKMPDIPTMPDFDLPVSVVMVHQLARSGLMVENITTQLGDFFGVKDGKGVLVRMVEKGSRGDKAGFRPGDVVVKVNNEPVHDTSDFTHAIHSSSSHTAAITVMRDKKEQTLTLTLPEKKDSGSLLNSFDIPEVSAETEQAINRAAEEVARMTPAIMESMQKHGLCPKNMEKKLKDAEQDLHDRQKELQIWQEKEKDWQEKVRHEVSGEWTEI